MELKKYLSSETEESFWFHHFLQYMALDASCAVILVHHSILQMDIVHCQTDMVFLPINDGNCVELVHHL